VIYLPCVGNREGNYSSLEWHAVLVLLVGIGTLPPLPSEPKGVGGHTRLRVRAWGIPNSDDWRKSLALCELCDGIPLQQANVNVI
jgi:hypothetical protein